MSKPVLRYTPKYEKHSFCKMIDFVFFHLIDWSNYTTHKGFLLFLPCDHHLSLSQCTRVVVDGPVIKDERYENLIEFQVSTIICERDNQDPQKKNKMNDKYYIHLI